MDKREFIQRIIDGFPSSFRDRNLSDVMYEYDIGIIDNLDYDKLYKLFVQNYDKCVPPRPAFFKDFYGECQSNVVSLLDKLPATKRAALVKIANWCNFDDYEKCLYEHKKAPPEIRMLQRKYQFSVEEIDQARMSEQLGEGKEENGVFQ